MISEMKRQPGIIDSLTVFLYYLVKHYDKWHRDQTEDDRKDIDDA